MIDIKVLLKTAFSEIPVEVKESFQLVKKRLLDGQAFIELTILGGGKKIYNKGAIAEITGVAEMVKPKKKK